MMEVSDTTTEPSDEKKYVKTKTFEKLQFVFTKRTWQKNPTCLDVKKAFGLNWQLSFDYDSVKATHFNLTMKCNDGSFSNVWELSCLMEVQIIDSDSLEIVKLDQKFNAVNNSVTIPDFLHFDSTHPSMTVELRITMKELIGLSKNEVFDFENAHEMTSDATLVLVDKDGNEEKKLHISKAYLSLHSPVFSTMFLKLHREGKTAEIKIQEDYKSILIILHLIYPSHSLPDEWTTTDNINAGDVGVVLKTAEKYKMDFAIREIEKFLIAAKGMKPFWKFHFAELHELDLLMNHCLTEIRSVKDASDAVKENDRSGFEMSNKTKAAVFGRLLSLPLCMVERESSSDSDHSEDSYY